jgi:hypothetical protein
MRLADEKQSLVVPVLTLWSDSASASILDARFSRRR